MVRVVTDSTSYLPPGLVEKLGIRVVPLWVRFGSLAFREGVDISNTEFYRMLAAASELPSTSQPSSGEFAEVYRSLAEEGAGSVVSVHISSGLSGTVQAAEAGAREVPDLEVAVVDSRGTGMALGFAVLAAAEAAASGASLTEVVGAAEETRDEVVTYFVVDTLEYLRKGGRIGRAEHLVGSLLQIKPVLSLEKGIIAPREKVRTMGRAMERVVGLIQEAAAGRAVEVAVHHAQAEERAMELAGRLEEAVRVSSLYISEVGPVVGCHTGPGLVGAVIRARR